MATIFSKIAAGEIPSYKIAEDDRFYAFFAMQVFAKGVAAAIKQVCPCIKVGQAVLGLEVPHAHIHLIPINKETDMLFSNPKLKLTQEEFQKIASAIHAAWESNR